MSEIGCRKVHSRRHVVCQSDAGGYATATAGWIDPSIMWRETGETSKRPCLRSSENWPMPAERERWENSQRVQRLRLVASRARQGLRLGTECSGMETPILVMALGVDQEAVFS